MDSDYDSDMVYSDCYWCNAKEGDVMLRSKNLWIVYYNSNNWCDRTFIISIEQGYKRALKAKKNAEKIQIANNWYKHNIKIAEAKLGANYFGPQKELVLD